MSCCDNGRGEDNCGLYLRAASINYFSSKLRLAFEGGLYLKAASIGENTVFKTQDKLFVSFVSSDNQKT